MQSQISASARRSLLKVVFLVLACTARADYNFYAPAGMTLSQFDPNSRLAFYFNFNPLNPASSGFASSPQVLADLVVSTNGTLIWSVYNYVKTNGTWTYSYGWTNGGASRYVNTTYTNLDAYVDPFGNIHAVSGLPTNTYTFSASGRLIQNSVQDIILVQNMPADPSLLYSSLVGAFVLTIQFLCGALAAMMIMKWLKTTTNSK